MAQCQPNEISIETASSAGPAPSNVSRESRVSRVEYPQVPRSTAGTSGLVANLAGQDWMVLGYVLALLAGVVVGSGSAIGRLESMWALGFDLSLLVVGLLVFRGKLWPWQSGLGGWMGTILYEATMIGVVAATYAQLKTVLPVVSSRVLDAELYDLDLRLFGFEPSLSWDRFVNPAVTEWFAFFYFSHFALITLHLGWLMFGGADSRRRYQFSLGALMLVCIGHLGYTLVPGYGPYRFLAHAFEHELKGGPFWQFVVRTVDAYGPQKDIFPSLHTATPTFFTLFAWRHRQSAPMRYTWPVLAFFTSQIVIATMFLRWHYLIDIVAGLTLAGLAAFVGDRVGGWEHDRRKATGVQPLFVTDR